VPRQRINSNNKTGFHGVHFCRHSQQFVAQVRVGGQTHKRKRATAEEAALAYDELALRLIGPDAPLNFPEVAQLELSARSDLVALCGRLRERGDGDSVAAAGAVEDMLSAFEEVLTDRRRQREIVARDMVRYRRFHSAVAGAQEQTCPGV
jgi:hypothetical protein